MFSCISGGENLSCFNSFSNAGTSGSGVLGGNIGEPLSVGGKVTNLAGIIGVGGEVSVGPVGGGLSRALVIGTRDGPVDPHIGAGVVVREAVDPIHAGGAQGVIDALAHSHPLQLVGHRIHQLQGAPLAPHIGDLHSDVGLGVGALNAINGGVVVVVGEVVEEDTGGVLGIRPLSGQGDAEGSSLVGNALLKDN